MEQTVTPDQMCALRDTVRQVRDQVGIFLMTMCRALLEGADGVSYDSRRIFFLRGAQRLNAFFVQTNEGERIIREAMTYEAVRFFIEPPDHGRYPLRVIPPSMRRECSQHLQRPAGDP